MIDVKKPVLNMLSLFIFIKLMIEYDVKIELS